MSCGFYENVESPISYTILKCITFLRKILRPQLLKLTYRIIFMCFCSNISELYNSRIELLKSFIVEINKTASIYRFHTTRNDGELIFQ